jgi:hypothetical protein
MMAIKRGLIDVLRSRVGFSYSDSGQVVIHQNVQQNVQQVEKQVSNVADKIEVFPFASVVNKVKIIPVISTFLNHLKEKEFKQAGELLIANPISHFQYGVLSLNKLYRRIVFKKFPMEVIINEYMPYLEDHDDLHKQIYMRYKNNGKLRQIIEFKSKFVLSDDSIMSLTRQMIKDSFPIEEVDYYFSKITGDLRLKLLELICNTYYKIDDNSNVFYFINKFDSYGERMVELKRHIPKYCCTHFKEFDKICMQFQLLDKDRNILAFYTQKMSAENDNIQVVRYFLGKMTDGRTLREGTKVLSDLLNKK